ncbi:MAG: sigma-70 family RNA polymerase sigma factor [Ignavibacteriae bacterium]|nr:sigma-70 family RNA polymerase sigma factor [Ignavibacteria bacterium]MBI3365844.1 sigma-70 family RNA polymerase sigma factor [Ignavibacteriota bacterium]
MVSRTSRDDDDRARLQRIAQGDESALSEMYDQYGQFLYSFVVRILHSVEEAEDVVQDVFLQVWKKAATYEQGKGTVYTWLVTMTRNRAIDRLRSKDFRAHYQQVDVNTVALAAESRVSNPHARSVFSDVQRVVSGTLSRLSLDQQQVLALAYYEGFSQSEIAKKLNIPLGTVKSRMRKALYSMRSMLQEKM